MDNNMFSQSTLVIDSDVNRLLHIDGVKRAVSKQSGVHHETRAYRKLVCRRTGLIGTRLCPIRRRRAAKRLRAENARRGEG